ncbi:MAG: cytochrome c peroxidase [Acidobacteriota bacterium]|jgi:cytochrome c peroxidase
MRTDGMTARMAGLTALLLLTALTLACSSKEEAPPGVETVAWEVVVPLGLSPDLQEPADNPTTREKVELGRLLYYDPRLSVAGDVSCATCHHPEKGFTDNLPVSTGHEGQTGARSAPPVTNATYNYVQFWDGRAGTLEEQALGPIENPVEMGNTLEGMIANVKGIDGYGPLFEAAFGDPEVTADRVAKAIAAFERTVLSGNSKWDRFMAGDETAMSEAEVRGWELFKGKAQCTLCHAGQTFSDSDFHNLGVGMAGPEPDLGRYEVTQADADRGAFKTPMLRDVTMTAPYMHDGSQATLEEVVEFYNQGGEPNEWLDPKIVPLNLTDQEKADLVAFMRALDGEIPNEVGDPGRRP